MLQLFFKFLALKIFNETIVKKIQAHNMSKKGSKPGIIVKSKLSTSNLLYINIKNIIASTIKRIHIQIE